MSSPAERFVVETSLGPAWADLDSFADGLLLVIGHGAGGGVDAPDLTAVREACVLAGISIARITQPYRVAGRRTAPTAATLDRAWLEIIAALPEVEHRQLIVGGRSSGARVACRTSSGNGVAPAAVAVIALAFPLHPPGKPEKSRLPELAAVVVPTLVVQGARDPFGQPPSAPGRTVITVAGDHSLRRAAGDVGDAVVHWLGQLPNQA